MDKFIFKKDIEQPNHQIRISSSCLHGSFLFCIGCLVAVALFQEDRWIFIGLALLVLLHGLLSFRNDRITYDETGITMYSILGKPFKTSWSAILNIDVVEEPLISKQLFIGRVLRIKCKEKVGSSVTIYRFPYRYYIGIDDFLMFSKSHLPSDHEQRKENHF